MATAEALVAVGSVPFACGALTLDVRVKKIYVLEVLLLLEDNGTAALKQLVQRQTVASVP